MTLEIVRLYSGVGAPISEIAKRVGVGHGTVLRELDRLKIKRRRWSKRGWQERL